MVSSLRIDMRPEVRKIVSNFGWLFWDRIIRMGLGLLIACWTARMLGPSSYGLLSWASSWVAMFSIIAILGLDPIVIRDIVKFPDETERILGTAFAMKLTGSLLMPILSIGILWMGGRWFHTSSGPVMITVVLIAAGYLFTALDTIDFWFQSQMASRNVVYAKSVSFVVVAGIKLWLLHAHAPVYAFAAAAACDSMLGAAGLYVSYVANRQSLRRWKFDGRWAKQMLGESWSVMVTWIAFMLQTNIDQVMLGVMVNHWEVGQFSAAVGMIDNLSFIPAIFYSTASPVIVQSKLIGEDTYYERLYKLYRLMFLASLGVAIGVFFLAKPVVAVFLGSKYNVAGTLLRILGIRLVLVSLGAARGVFVNTDQLNRYGMLTSGLGSIANVVLNCLLIPHYGAIGAIIAMILALVITVFAVDVFYPPVRRNLRTMLCALLTPWRLSVT